MSSHDTLTTLVCLFHTQDHALAASRDLVEAGIPQSSISHIGGPDAEADALDTSSLGSLGMPDRDYDHLKQGIRDGGVVVAVSDTAETDTIERIFHKHSADQIDEADINRATDTLAEAPLAAAPLAAAPLLATDELVSGERAIPIIEEDLQVGKRSVDAGGVRVYRRVVEIPVEESVSLREEHVNIDRRAVDRPATDADLTFAPRTVELTETAEEAVVGKSARVVEEVLVGKVASEHTETIHDTVRRTEVEVEQVPATETYSKTESHSATDPIRRG